MGCVMGFLVDRLRAWRYRWVVIGALERVRASEPWARARGRLDLFHRREDLQRWCVDERASERTCARAWMGHRRVICVVVRRRRAVVVDDDDVRACGCGVPRGVGSVTERP